MRYSKTKNKQVVSIESGQKLSEVKAVLIDYDNGKFIGLALKNKTVIYAEDVAEFGKDAVMVRAEKELVPLKDNAKFEELIKSKIKIAGNKAVTRSGVELGEVKDFEVDEVEKKLAKIFVSIGFIKDLFKGELQITFDKIISIGRDAIIVKDAAVPTDEKEKVKKEVENLAEAGILNKEVE